MTGAPCPPGLRKPRGWVASALPSPHCSPLSPAALFSPSTLAACVVRSWQVVEAMWSSLHSTDASGPGAGDSSGRADFCLAVSGPVPSRPGVFVHYPPLRKDGGTRAPFPSSSFSFLRRVPGRSSGHWSFCPFSFLLPFLQVTLVSPCCTRVRSRATSLPSCLGVSSQLIFAPSP